MAIIVLLLTLSTWILLVHASNETLVHGWQPEPQGRGTFSILWSSLITIVLCTWSVLHLATPHNYGKWHLRTRKFNWMLLTVLLPEWTLGQAALDYCKARALSKFLAREN